MFLNSVERKQRTQQMGTVYFPILKGEGIETTMLVENGFFVAFYPRDVGPLEGGGPVKSTTNQQRVACKTKSTQTIDHCSGAILFQ